MVSITLRGFFLLHCFGIYAFRIAKGHSRAEEAVGRRHLFGLAILPREATDQPRLSEEDPLGGTGRMGTLSDPRENEDREQVRSATVHQDLTLATTINVNELKGLDEHLIRNVIEWKSISSFLQIVAAENVIVFVDQKSECPFLTELFEGINCREVPCTHSKTKRPVISCMIEDGEAAAKTNYFAFVNGDIMLSTDFISTVDWAISSLPHFLLVGVRTDIGIQDMLFISPKTLLGGNRVLKRLRAMGSKHGEWGIDVFVYRVGDRPKRKFPGFVAGNWRWDNWLLAEFISEGKVKVVDMSDTVLILHQDRAQEQLLGKYRPASAYNNFLAHQSTGEKFQMGKITNADLVLGEGCSRLDCLVLDNINHELKVALHRKASPDGYIVLVTVNHGYLGLFKNWLCWARKLNFRNFIVLAEDGHSYHTAQQEGCAVILQSGAPRKRDAAEYGSKEFQATMKFRTDIVLSVLTSGFHAVIADLDTVWLENPIPKFPKTCTLSGQAHKETSMSGGLIIVRSGSAGVRFWKDVIACQTKNMEFIANHAIGTYDVSKYTEQECINSLANDSRQGGDFTFCLLPPLLFPDGKRFFEQNLTQKHGVKPVIIHNNWITGKQNKIDRFQAWGLWMVDAEWNCMPELVGNDERGSEN